MTLAPEKLSALLPCPFCGAPPHKGMAKKQLAQDGEYFQRYEIWCPHECARINRPDEEWATAVWNSRAVLDLLDLVQAQADRIAVLTEALTAASGVIAAARKMPRATPAPGGAGTDHAFKIVASTVWGLDAALTAYDAALSALTPTDNREPDNEPRRLPRLLGERRFTDMGGPSYFSYADAGMLSRFSPNRRSGERRKA